MALLTMIRDDLENIPQYPLPDGCNIHAMKPDEESYWCWICEGAFGHPFDFEKFMKSAPCYAPERILMGQQYSQVTATAAAWAEPEFGAHTGELHMVATHPTAHGEGLGRPMISAALNKLCELGYTRAFLTTDDQKIAAIKLYSEFGFRPVYDSAEKYEADIRPAADSEQAQVEARALWQEVEAQVSGCTSIRGRKIQLWENGAPLFDASYDQAQPTIKCFPVEGSKGAVVVCPGGGYVMKASHEGDPIARMLNEAGISAYVLDYRVAPYIMPAPVLDANRAIKVVRSLGYDKVGILGFSAGGHLTAIAGTMYDLGKPDDPDPIEHYSSRPDAFVPCYAVISFTQFTHGGSRMNIMGKDADNWPELRKMSAEMRVNENTPPCFMWHTASDNCVPVENSLRMAEACVRYGVPVELHIFPRGEHGLGLAGGTHVNQWNKLCQNWLLALGFGK